MELIDFKKHFHIKHFEMLLCKNKYGSVFIDDGVDITEVSFFDQRGFLLENSMEVKGWDDNLDDVKIIGDVHE